MLMTVKVNTWVAFSMLATPLDVCKTLQLYYGISLLYEQGHNAEVLGVELGFKTRLGQKTLLIRVNSIK